jgi:hypothetical protein
MDTIPQANPDEASPRRLWTADYVRAFFGGEEKPIALATLYRGMTLGRYPKPIDVGGVRWIAAECEAALQRMIDKRNSGEITARQQRTRNSRRRTRNMKRAGA